MSVYLTEEEQLDAIKKWWHRYGTVITITLSIILLCISGYRYWTWHLDKKNTDASITYERLMSAFSNQDNKAIRAYAYELISTHKKTVYADAARLTLAKIYVNAGEFEKAKKELTYLANNSSVSALQQVARIRMARLLAGEKSYQQALAELSQVKASNYMPLVDELRGDIYSATGNNKQAMLAYEKAMQENRQHGIGNPYLEMKTGEIAALTQSKNNYATPRTQV